MDQSVKSRLWIFGYGSLCWRPGFQYDRVFTGYINGYSRKFWQGNTTHRGTVDKPGRVATLVEDENSAVWGCAYEISGETALPYLTKRECQLGGYLTKFATFYHRETEGETKTAAQQPFMVMLYIATPNNDLWLGDAPLVEIAAQITECSGESGHNVEYLIRLAEFMRDNVPEAIDEHLFSLEHMVRTRIKQENLSIISLMGDGRGLRSIAVNRSRNNSPDRDNQQEEAAARVDTFQYTARIPEKNLRCLNL